MKYTIPISLEGVRKNAATYWEYINGKKKRNTIINVIVGVVALVLLLFIGDLKPWHYIFGTLGGVLFITYSLYFFILRSHKEKYIKKVQETNGYFAKVDIELTDDDFKLYTPMYEIRVNWKLGSSYLIFRGVFFLNYHDSPLLMISLEDISEEDFNRILAYIKTKAKGAQIN
jgi:hypothetical protein